MADNPKEKPGMSRNLKSLLITCGFLLVIAAATAVEITVKSHQQRPLLGNVVAIAILNVNILLIAVLLMLLGRQLVKFYFERKASPFGAGFRSKLVISFIGLSIVPAGLLFIVAGGMLTGSVKYWFSPRVENTMRDSIALAKSYREDRKNMALHYAGAMADQLMELPINIESVKRFTDAEITEYSIDLIEVYALDGTLLITSGSEGLAWTRPGKNFIEGTIKAGRLFSVTSGNQGEVVRGAQVIIDKAGRPRGVIVATYVIPSAISNNMADITRFYEEYWDLRTFKNPLKESYMLSFVLLALVILFAAVWFGLYISKGITVPITSLAEATHRISRGEYDFQIDIDAHDEIGVLVDSFKRMTHDLKASQEKLNEANISLSRTNDLLEQRRQFIETVLENVNTGVITIDRAGKISTLNRAGERIMGVDKYDILGKNYREVFESHQLNEIREQVRAMSDSGASSVERNLQMTINRRSLTLRLFVSALHDTAGSYLGILVVFEDLTELIKAQRAAAWKEVARRIAHEVKNPLTPIQLSAQRLRKRFLEGTGDYGPIINECTETIITQVEGMKKLVDEFSKFARMPEVVPHPTSLHGLIDEAAALYLGAHRDIEIMKDYDPDITTVNVDGEQMKRAFMNLFDNAVTAMDGRGTLWIKTAREPGVVRIEVADEGPGIAPEDSERMFQPYFSKKKSGTGLGLAIVSRIISDHGGYIKVESNEPKGARFVIELPVKA